MKRTAGVGCRGLFQKRVGAKRLLHVKQGDPRGLDPPDRERGAQIGPARCKNVSPGAVFPMRRICAQMLSLTVFSSGAKLVKAPYVQTDDTPGK